MLNDSDIVLLEPRVDLCQICNKNEKDVYQLDFEVCFDCWMNETSPKISY